MKMIKCLYHRLWYQLMTPACLQPALRSYVKASKKSRSTMVLTACSHSNKTPNDQAEPRFCGRKAKCLLLNAEPATNRPLPVLSHPRPPLSLVFFFHQQPVHWVRSSSEASILCLPSVCTHSVGQSSFSYAAPSVWTVSLAKLDQPRSHL